ncbi:MAG: hypothetical protein ABFD89_27720, partial [Bryobacteraceae bacterium]
MADLQVLTPSGPVTVHLAERRPGGALHWRFWDTERRNWRYGSTKTFTRRAALAEAQKAVLRIFSNRPSSTGGWTLGDAANVCLRDRFPDAATDATGPGLNDLPKRLQEGHAQWDTYRDARARLLTFVNFAGARTELGSADTFTGWCQGFLSARRAKGIGATGLSNDQRAISRLAAWIMSRRPAKVDWPSNPAARKLLELPKVLKQTRRSPPAEAVSKLLEHLKGTDIYPAVVLILSGLRPVGSGRITWEQISLDHSHATVTEKNESRLLRLGKWATAELSRWHELAGKPVGEVWPFTRLYLFVRFRRLADAAGCQGLTLQGLRRHVSQRLYAANVAPQIEAKVLGHSVQTAMRHYVDLAALEERPDVENALDYAR